MEAWLIVAVIGAGFIGDKPMTFDHKDRYFTEQACLRAKPGIQANAESRIRLVMDAMTGVSMDHITVTFECRQEKVN